MLLSPDLWNLGEKLCPDPEVVELQETECPELAPVSICRHLV